MKSSCRKIIATAFSFLLPASGPFDKCSTHHKTTCCFNIICQILKPQVGGTQGEQRHFSPVVKRRNEISFSSLYPYMARGGIGLGCSGR